MRRQHRWALQFAAWIAIDDLVKQHARQSVRAVPEHSEDLTDWHNLFAQFHRRFRLARFPFDECVNGLGKGIAEIAGRVATAAGRGGGSRLSHVLQAGRGCLREMAPRRGQTAA